MSLFKLLYLTCLFQKLEKDGILDSIALAFRTGTTEYSVSELGIPGLRHFVYKSRPQVQVTVPVFEDPYDDITERRRYVIVVLYVSHSEPLT
jgi:vacuolar fusion protein MON1